MSLDLMSIILVLIKDGGHVCTWITMMMMMTNYIAWIYICYAMQCYAIEEFHHHHGSMERGSSILFYVSFRKRLSYIERDFEFFSFCIL